MIKLKNKLTISISDIDNENDSEENNQSNQIKTKAEILSEYNSKNQPKYVIDEELVYHNHDLRCIVEYMEGKNSNHDISYMWLDSLTSVSSLSKSVFFSPKSWESFFSFKDFQDEFAVS